MDSSGPLQPANATLRVPISVQISRGVVATQGGVLGCASALAALLGLMTVASGAQWRLLALAMFGVAVLAAAGAAFFCLLWAKLKGRPDRWRFVTLATQALLIAPGIALYNLVAGYQPGTPANPGTDGPFADGGTGVIGLLGFAFAGGGTLAVTLLLWEQLRRLFRWRTQRVAR